MNNRVTIYIPLYLSKQNNKLNDWKTHHACALSEENFRKNGKVDFDLIAGQITAALAINRLQVGRDVEEVWKIVNQHSYYKCYHDDFYIVETYVRIADLECFAAAEEVQDGEKFLCMERHAVIPAENINRIILSNNNSNIHHIEMNNRFARFNTEYNSSDQAIESFKKFLYDREFWRKHVNALNIFTPFPTGIMDMQKSIEKKSIINLVRLQEIAAKHLQEMKSPLGSMATLFAKEKNNPVSKNFYEAIISARSLHEINDWISHHYPDPKQEIELRKIYP